MQAPPQPASIPDVGMLLLIGLCIGAAMKDRVYKKLGGVKPDRFERITLLCSILGAILVDLIFFLRSPEAAGTLLPVLIVVVFGFWEIQRWRIRKNSPLGAMTKVK
jgi:hypothetical protein